MTERRRLNFRPRGNRAPGCRISYRPSPISTLFAFLVQAARARARLFLSRQETNPRDDNARRMLHSTGFARLLLTACRGVTKARCTSLRPECYLLLSRRVFTHRRTVMNSRWSSNARYSPPPPWPRCFPALFRVFN